MVSTERISHAFHIINPRPLFAPTISAIEISTSPMPMPSFTPVRMSGMAPGNATVRNTCQRLAPKFFDTSK